MIGPVDLAPGYSCAIAVGIAATALHTFTFSEQPSRRISDITGDARERLRTES